MADYPEGILPERQRRQQEATNSADPSNAKEVYAAHQADELADVTAGVAEPGVHRVVVDKP